MSRRKFQQEDQALDEDDTMTPTERELMAEVGDKGESE